MRYIICNESHMDLFFPLIVVRPRIVYDLRQAMPLLPIRGELHITMDQIDLDIVLVTAKQKDRVAPW
ncbi:hypothetical protein HPB51_012026 [Rhipicephalus microplus]|uniref:Uncharacterized protein n=1 Tax=Rhipicephalus microplus TaxID=6941 RepID=A0A9J6F2G1_RHIMP|nr:hypothetical protein HPB51_012026 [Rhipicephalus microplus]